MVHMLPYQVEVQLLVLVLEELEVQAQQQYQAIEQQTHISEVLITVILLFIGL